MSNEIEELINKMKETPIVNNHQHLDICLENTGGLPVAFYLNPELKMVTCTYQHTSGKGFGTLIGDIAYDFELNFNLIIDKKHKINTKVFTLENPLYLFLLPFQPFELGDTVFRCKIGFLDGETKQEIGKKAGTGFVSNGIIYRGGFAK